MIGIMTNNDRADKAAKALEAYSEVSGYQYSEEPLEDRVGDLIGDLLHLIRRDIEEEASIIEPVELLDRGRTNFEAEEEEEAAE